MRSVWTTGIGAKLVAMTCPLLTTILIINHCFLGLFNRCFCFGASSIFYIKKVFSYSVIYMSLISKRILSLGNLGRKGRDCCSIQKDSRKEVPTVASCFPKELPRAFTQTQRLHQCLQHGSAEVVRGEVGAAP